MPHAHPHASPPSDAPPAVPVQAPIPPEGNEGPPVGTGTPTPHGRRQPSSGVGGAKKG